MLQILGSLKIAVGLLVTIAGVLAWGTFYEVQFGTASVQRFVYQSWWFQALLGFLALNLAVAALRRYPWKRRHVPFVLAHIGIILILIGGIIGGRFGIEGQLIIPEGQAERTLQLPKNVLVVYQSNPGVHHVLPTDFATRAWVHEPLVTFPLDLEGRAIELTVDRYYPDSVRTERITGDGDEDNPAVQVRIAHEQWEDTVWLFARDPERFGVGWKDASLLFLEPETAQQLAQLTHSSPPSVHSRGLVSLRLPGQGKLMEVPVPDILNQTQELTGTPYRLTFRDYFPDFVLSAEGPSSRSDQPNNPAVAFTLSGPEGTDAHLLFALHPEFPRLHGRTQRIEADVTYAHAARASLPPHSIGLIHLASGGLAAVLTGEPGQHEYLDTLEVGQPYTHPWLGYQFHVVTYEPKAHIIQEMTNRSDEVRVEALHLIAREGDQTDEAWLGLRGMVELSLSDKPISVEYRPAQWDLPFVVKLIDFRKITYPGIEMAAGFESDVELTDAERGIILIRKISMNKPLKYRGFSLFQSSFVDGPVQMTVLSVRNDPGTPVVYAGFIIVILGVLAMFILRSPRFSQGRGAKS